LSTPLAAETPFPPAEQDGLNRQRKFAIAAVAVFLFPLAVLGVCAAFWFSLEANNAKGDLATVGSELEAAQQERSQARLAEADANTAAAMRAATDGDSGRALLLLANAIGVAHAEGESERERSNRIRFRNIQRQMATPLQAIAGLPAGSELRSWAIHPSGHWALLQASDRSYLWDLKEEAEKPLPASLGSGAISAAAWSNDGLWLALGTNQQGVFLCRFPAQELRLHIEVPGPVRTLRFSGDDNLLAIGGDSLRIWNCRFQQFLAKDCCLPCPALTLSFSSTGDRLMVGCEDGKIQGVGLADGKCEPLFQIDCEAVSRLSYMAPNGRLLLTIAPDRRQMAAWDIDAGRIKFHLPKTPSEFALQCLAISPNGQFLALGGLEGVGIFDLSSGQRTRLHNDWLDHSDVQALTFTPDNRMLISGGCDGAVRFWNPDGQPCAPSILFSEPIVGIQLLADGRQFAVVAESGSMSIWTLPKGSSERFERRLSDGPIRVMAHPDDQHFLVCGTLGFARPMRTTRVLNGQTGEPAGPSMEARGHILQAALCPTHPWTALAVTAAVPKGSHLLEVWNWQTGQRLYEPIALSEEPLALAFHPEGWTLAVLTAGGRVQLFDPQTGRQTRAWSYPQPLRIQAEALPGNGELRFSPDGQSLLTWRLDNSLRVWDTHSGQLRYVLQQGNGVFQSVAFSPDIRRLATGHSRQNVAIWNFATGEQDADAKVPLHFERSSTLQFTADRNHLLVAGQNGQVQLWDWRTGQFAGRRLMNHSPIVFAHALPESPWLVTAGINGLPRIWDGRSGQPLNCGRAISNGRCQNCIILGKGHTLVAAQSDGNVRGYDLADMLLPSSIGTADGGDNDSLMRLAQYLSGSERVKSGIVQPLPAEEWRRLHRKINRESVTDAN
jgi:WD40 repeat protein